MRCRFFLGALVLTFGLFNTTSAKAANMTFHDFTFTSIEGEPMPASGFAGKAVLVVNTASFCGFTKQYDGLQALWEKYREKGLVVLGIPSNDFGAQEPGTSEEIQTFCTTNFAIDFPMTEKAVVKGPDAHPFYKWAAEKVGAIWRVTSQLSSSTTKRSCRISSLHTSVP